LPYPVSIRGARQGQHRAPITEEPAITDRRARRHEATRQEILEAAWSLARDRGLTGWSLREVAQAVGMRAPSLYVYFENKDAIYDAMFAQGYAELLSRLEATALTDDPAQDLRRGAHLFFDFCVEDPARQQLMFLRVIPGFVPSPQAYELAQRALEELRGVLADAGMAKPATVDLWTAVMTGLATQQVSNDPGGQRWALLVDHAVDLLLTGASDRSDPASASTTLPR
jgi:AcrR family transcriptional regulator